MRLVIQRVSRASVTTEGKLVAEIAKGLLVLIGVGKDDNIDIAQSLAEKTATLRIFSDTEGKTNLSVQDVEGEVLAVSQFTLYADTRRGRRPSFTDAADPKEAEQLVGEYVNELRKQGLPVKTGVFGAHMLVELVNDGPVTILLEK